MGDNLRRAISDQGWTLGTLSRAAGIGKMTLHHMLERNTHAPLRTYLKVSEAMGISLDELAALIVADISLEKCPAPKLQVITNSCAGALIDDKQVDTLNPEARYEYLSFYLAA